MQGDPFGLLLDGPLRPRCGGIASTEAYCFSSLNMADANETSPAHTTTPWIVSHSQNPDVYHNEEHWLIVSHPVESTAEAIADIETGPGPERARANAEFIARACNAHDALLDACYLALEEIEQWNEVMGGSEDERTQVTLDALKSALRKANENAA